MSQSTVLDVLIVYNGSLVQSASSTASEISTPFAPDGANASCNAAYAYFLASCAKLKLSAGLSSSDDIIGAGSCQSYWTYQNKSWVKHHLPCRSRQIFDKFSPKTPESLDKRHLLFLSPKVSSFNSYSLFKLFFDKQKTYAALSSFAIPTMALKDHSLKSVTKSCQALAGLVNSQAHPKDFSTQIVLKDRFGAGGRNVYKYRLKDYSSIRETLVSHPQLSFVIQPLIKFNRGFKYQNRFVSTDIRLIFLRNKIVASYARIAKDGDFRCNQHQGGSLIYLNPQTLPPSIIKSAGQIAKILHQQNSLFTLDFLLSNTGHAYFLEGNTGPGLNWDSNDAIDQRESKKLIRQIVAELSTRHFIQSKPNIRLRSSSLSPSFQLGFQPSDPAGSPISLRGSNSSQSARQLFAD